MEKDFNIKSFITKKVRKYLNENIGDKTYSGDEVWEYFSNIVSKHHSKYDDPIHNQHKEEILNNKYVLRDINISDLIKNDVDLKDFIDTQFDDYKQEWGKNNVNSYGLIGNSSFANDVLIDGYHRLMQKLVNGENSFTVFVPLNSKFYK